MTRADKTGLFVFLEGVRRTPLDRKVRLWSQQIDR